MRQKRVKTMALENLEEMLRKRSKQPCVEVLSLRCGTSAGRQESLCPSLALTSCLLYVIFLSLLLAVPEAFWNRHQRDYHKAISTPLKVITAFFHHNGYNLRFWSQTDFGRNLIFAMYYLSDTEQVP